MTSDELKEGCAITLRVAHKLRHDLGRFPTPMEIQWRTATQLQARAVRECAPLTRMRAMTLAQQMMDVVSTATQYTNH